MRYIVTTERSDECAKSHTVATLKEVWTLIENYGRELRRSYPQPTMAELAAGKGRPHVPTSGRQIVKAITEEGGSIALPDGTTITVEPAQGA